jgi:AbrB family looped-hinge helix DNA binding protein
MEATLTRRNQILIPKEAREALGVKAGDKLLVVVHRNTLTVLPRPKSFAKALRGLAKGIYPPDYLLKRRKSRD